MNDIEERKKIGETIRIARKSKKITQAELGRILGTGSQVIYDYEKGNVKIIPFDKRIVLSEVLEIPIFKLLYENEKSQKIYFEILGNNKIIDNEKTFDEIRYMKFATDSVVKALREKNTHKRNIKNITLKTEILSVCKVLSLGSAIKVIKEYYHQISSNEIDELNTCLKELFLIRGLSDKDAYSLAMYIVEDYAQNNTNITKTEK